MTTLLSVGGTLIGSAVICKLLEITGQDRISKILATTVTIAFLLFLSQYVMGTSWDIIYKFGGLPR